MMLVLEALSKPNFSFCQSLSLPAVMHAVWLDHWLVRTEEKCHRVFQSCAYPGLTSPSREGSHFPCSSFYHWHTYRGFSCCSCHFWPDLILSGHYLSLIFSIVFPDCLDNVSVLLPGYLSLLLSSAGFLLVFEFTQKLLFHPHKPPHNFIMPAELGGGNP